MNDKDFYYNNKGQMTVEFNHDTLVLVYVKNIITVTKIVQGVEAKNLPKDYKVTVELAKVNGNQKKLVTLSDFKEIEKVNANDAGGLFASGTIQASELGLQDGDRYTVVERLTEHSMVKITIVMHWLRLLTALMKKLIICQ